MFTLTLVQRVVDQTIASFNPSKGIKGSLLEGGAVGE